MKRSWNDTLTGLKGFAMGAANVVPGVSGEGVDKVHIAALLYPGKQGGWVGIAQAVPADVGQLFRCGDAQHPSFDKAQTGTGAHLVAALKEKLHAKTDAQNGLLFRLLTKHLVQSGGGQSAPCVGESAHTGKNDGV